MHYLKGSCIYDLLACIPFEFIISNRDGNKDARLLKLFKMLRVPRLVELLNVERVKKIINSYYNN